jgi:hypothetical protein
MGVMQTEMKREIPSAVRKPPMINLGHISSGTPPLVRFAVLLRPGYPII